MSDDAGRMNPEELRVRSLYLFLACTRAVDQFKARLLTTMPSPIPSQPMVERMLRRELGLLFRYWITRQVWERLEASEADAKKLNLALLRLFTEGFRLPKDGSGLRYAEMSTLAEEVRELSHRITNALGAEHPALLSELSAAILPWRDAVGRYTVEALELPVTQLTSSVKEWAERMPGTPA